MTTNAASALLPIFQVKVNGTALPDAVISNLQDAEVDVSVYLPAMLSLSFYDPDYSIAQRTDLRPGTSVAISLGRLNSVEEVFQGEIAAVEPVFSGSHEPPLFVVRAYDKGHRLHSGRKSATYVQVTDSDMVSVIARRSGLTAQAEATTAVHPYVLQDTQTDWEFLQQLAVRNGFVVRVEGTTLHFKKPQDLATGAVCELDLAEQLMEFRPRLSMASQFDTVQVRDWDYKQKQALVGDAGAPDSFPHPSANGHSLASAAGITSDLTVTGMPVGSAGEATALAKSLLTQARFGDVQAEGMAFIEPKIKAGGKVRIAGVPSDFGGEYLVTRVRHVYSGKADITRTYFEATTGSAATAGRLFLEGAGRPHAQVQGATAAPAVVTQVKDGDGVEKFGSVKVKYPWMRGESGDIESHWLRLIAPGAGASRGIMFMPEINDEVVVLFDRGNPARGYVLGGVWNGQDATPITAAAMLEDNNKIKVREIKTRMGSVLRFTDAAAGTKIEVIDSSGKNSVTIEQQGNKVTVKSDMEVTVETKTVNVKGTQQINIDGGTTAPVNVKGSQIKVEGTQVEVKATGTAKVESSGTLDLKGSMVTIDGGGMLTLKGGIVKIN